MALLNPPDVVPEAMRFLLRAVLAFPSATCAQEDLLALVAPSGLVEAMSAIGTSIGDGEEGADDPRTGGSKIADASLGALRRLGLVQVDSGSVSASDAVTSMWRTSKEVTATAFAGMVRQAVWRTRTSGDTEGVADLIQAVALLTAAPEPLRPFDGFDEPTANRRFDQYQIGHLGLVQANWAVGNLERWRAFRRFAPYLGLAVPVGTKVGQRVSARGLLADCSPALTQELTGVEPGTYEVSAFVALCAEKLPFLDGGRFAVDDDRSPQDLSGGLSLSLRQLEASGLLALLHESDADTRVLDLGNDPRARVTISHVRWIELPSKTKGPRS